MSGRGHPSAPTGGAIRLYGRRVMLRPLTAADWQQWSEVRQRNEQWLTPWEPLRPANLLDPTRDRDAFSSRCSARDRDRQMGIAFGFGVFVGAEFAGEINLNGIVRGAHQGGTIGYWIDRAKAGHRYIAEGVATVMRFSFEQLHLHRLEICIVPRNFNSRRVVEVLALREEGVAQRFLEINGAWEDHVRYGITAEEWQARRAELSAAWL
ncbi:MAG: GNAT family N-acetyltransferase [Actinobacteria bacterium]|jgi:ribosomal-protein-alanine N-acetyltransferase|nr:GNAT family N-acetyltransferase [Acidimicrobiaceae bacterium]MBP6486350.1 GNAT family N-acetyltransferase [Ilumatobacteraceae bacterium]NMD25166.1 GNAT family N-acetyltransferase [Actinomycetota bacterium]MBP7889768.1 GNAT family N-acetyltransferase [Ilumatobacteraceae bacterium]MBP8209545.1 GNAT family N-acetyltransferase [Ilumatobacteraceae bacterium]